MSKQSENQEFNYPWEEAPEWAEWAATDEDGEEWWFEYEPFFNSAGVWMDIGGKINRFSSSDYPLIDPKNSLQQRPKK